MLSIENLSISYNNNNILNNVNFNIERGEIVALLGDSGSGKSSILKFIAGLMDGQNGNIILNRLELTKNGKHLIPVEKRQVGMVFQDYSLFPNMNIFKNISFGMSGNKAIKTLQVKKLLTLIDLEGIELRYPHELSGGEQQRIALVRSLAINPQLMLLDEPFSSLDKTHRERLVTDVRNILKQTNITTIFVTHDENDAKNLADKIIKIKNKTLTFIK